VSRTLPRVLTGERLPARLRDLPDPPEALFVRGDLPRSASVAIVGTRKPTPEAARFAHDLARDLALAGAAIVSGGAEGIDTEAHAGALSARGLTAVLAPSGYAAPFPQENAALFQRIVASGGAYAALVPDDQVAMRPAFFRRNACLVALAHVVVVVQAPIRSGARNAASWARRLGRPLLVVPSAPWVHEGKGCVLELRAGAQLCDSARTVLEVLERTGVIPIPPTGRRGAKCKTNSRLVGLRSSGRLDATLLQEGDEEEQLALFQTSSVSGALSLTPLERQVLAMMGERMTHVDEVCDRLGLPAARAQQLLLTLTLRGVLVPAPAGGFQRLSSRKF
jgi:DNA processing protein